MKYLCVLLILLFISSCQRSNSLSNDKKIEQVPEKKYHIRHYAGDSLLGEYWVEWRSWNSDINTDFAGNSVLEFTDKGKTYEISGTIVIEYREK